MNEEHDHGLRNEHRILEHIERTLERIEKLLVTFREATALTIIQGGTMSNVITGIPAGGTGTFSLGTQPPGSIIKAGAVPVWVSDSALAVAVPSADGLTCVVTVDPSATVGAAFNLSVSVQQTAGVAAGTASVPILSPTVTTGGEATSLDIIQTAQTGRKR
jgi:hypothetical protein